MVCSCHAADACEHKVATVLAFHEARGPSRLIELEQARREASAGAARTRDEVLDSVCATVREMVALGTSRLSRATAERLRTLAVSAHGVDLPRLERLLRALADGVEQGLARAAQADATALLAQAARAEALSRALQHRPTAGLIGEHRSNYALVGDIEIVGAGARRWRARSGYQGLTVYFWDRSAQGWASWTEARPLTSGGDFDPAGRYHADGPWPGVVSPAEASRSVVRLTGAYRNRVGRLSGRPSTKAIHQGPADAAALPPRIEGWAELAERARMLFGGGFRERSEQDEVVLLAPASWGPSRFDPVRQELVRELFDGDGKALPLVLSFTPETEDAVPALEAHDPSATHSVLGLLRLDAERLYVEPVALHGAKAPLNLTLDAAPSSPAAHRPTVPIDADEAGDDEPGDEAGELARVAPPTKLGVLLDALAAHLEAIGEGGHASFRAIDALRGLAARADVLGLSSCARPVGRVLENLTSQRRGEPIDLPLAARDLLRAYYTVRLAAAQETLAAATSRLVHDMT
jgi:hypothetical protein